MILWRFTTDEFYDLKGRGREYFVKCPVYVPDRSNDPFHGNMVEINGRSYLVLGVNSYALGWINKGAPIGLLVKEDEDEQALR